MTSDLQSPCNGPVKHVFVYLPTDHSVITATIILLVTCTGGVILAIHIIVYVHQKIKSKVSKGMPVIRKEL